MPLFPGTRHLPRWTPRTAVATVAVVTTLLSTAAPAAAATWGVVRTPNRNTFNNGLWGIDATGPAHAWAVGYADTGTTPSRQPMIQRWDGTRWRIIDSPTLDGGGELRSVDTLSDTQAWAVGSAGTGNGDAPLAERWDGTSWQRVKSPAVGTLNYLLGVRAFAATDVWAVGTANVPGTPAFRTLIQRWDGASWSVVPGPNPAPFENRFSAVDGSGPADVWAVGHSRTGPDGVEQPLVAHYDGLSWTTVPTPPVGAATLRDVVVVSSTDAWAVGWAFSPELRGDVPYTLHWDGTAWRTVTLPAVRRGERLYGVTALSGNRVYAVGQRDVPGFSELAVRWNGATWRYEVLPNTARWAHLYDAAAAPTTGVGDVWAAGDIDFPTANLQTFTTRTLNG
jgi:hypothetical protein